MSFLLIGVHFISFSCPIALAGTSSAVLGKSGEGRRPCHFFLVVGESFLSLTIKYVNYRYFVDAL